MWRHGLVTGASTRAIAKQEGAPQIIIDESLTAGLLHDLGLLVLAVNLPDGYREAVALVRERGIAGWRAEREVFGASHAEVGAYLLGIWGLNEAIVEAVAFHHRPGAAGNRSFGPLTAVHVADVFEEADRAEGVGESSAALDDDYLSYGGWSDRFPVWQAASRERG